MVHQIRIIQIHFHSDHRINSRIRVAVCLVQIRTHRILVGCLVIQRIIVHLVQIQTVGLDQILAVDCSAIQVILIRTLGECSVPVDLVRPNHKAEHKKSSNLLCHQIQHQKVVISRRNFYVILLCQNIKGTGCFLAVCDRLRDSICAVV